jgi:hypothetical protein
MVLVIELNVSAVLFSDGDVRHGEGFLSPDERQL